MRTPNNPTLEKKVSILEYKLNTLQGNYKRLYDWAYSHRIRRTEADEKMLAASKRWYLLFMKAIEKGSEIKRIHKNGKHHLKIILDKNKS